MMRVEPNRRFSAVLAQERETAARTNQRQDGETARRVLRRSVARVLAAWTLEEVEFAAWQFALDGWQQMPPLVEDYDLAFEQFSGLIERQEDAAAHGGLGILLGELRNRAQFLQRRAADIRFSIQLGNLLVLSQERAAPQLLRLAEDIEAKAGDATAIGEVVRTFEATSAGALVRTITNQLGRRSGAAGAAIDAFSQEAARVARALAPVAQNVVSNWLWEAMKEWTR